MSNFYQLLNNSLSSENKKRIRIILKEIFGQDKTILENSVNTDDKGIDFYIFSLETKIKVDVKIRNRCSYNKDVALEIWSNIEKQKPGWTLDDTKLTDYIVWIWQDNNYYFVDFKKLKRIFKKYKEKWMNDYYSPTQCTTNHNYIYHSQCVFVPIREINEKLNMKY